MAFLENVTYRFNHQFYLRYDLQPAGAVLTTTAVEDPAVLSTGLPATLVGVANAPGWGIADNLAPIEGAGAYQQLGAVPGQRAYTISMPNINVMDGLFWMNAVRAYDAGVGTSLGLPYMTLDLGCMDEYGADDSESIQAFDCLINTWSLTWREGAWVVGQAELWPSIFVPGAAGQASMLTTPGEDVMRWESAFIGAANQGAGADDLRNLIQSVTIQGTNNLRRFGNRGLCLDAATGALVQLCSRTPYVIKPGQEVISVSMTLHDAPPSELREPQDWGALTLSAINAAGDKALNITLDTNWMSSLERASGGANDQVTYSARMLNYGITIDNTPP